MHAFNITQGTSLRSHQVLRLSSETGDASQTFLCTFSDVTQPCPRPWAGCGSQKQSQGSDFQPRIDPLDRKEVFLEIYNKDAFFILKNVLQIQRTGI
jgi:hypothetical protein